MGGSSYNALPLFLGPCSVGWVGEWGGGDSADGSEGSDKYAPANENGGCEERSKALRLS